MTGDTRPGATRRPDVRLARPWASGAFVALALAGPPAFVVGVDGLFGSSPVLTTQLAMHLVYCLLAAVLVRGALRVERLPLASIGLRKPTPATVVVAAGVVLFAQFVLLPLMLHVVRLGGTEAVDAGVQRLVTLPVWFRLVLAVTGGAIEETLYRGYAIERLIALTGRRWLGGAIAAFAFGLAHIPAWGGVFSLAADLPFGILMTVVYLWRRDLLANVLAHSAGLVIGLAFTL